LNLVRTIGRSIRAAAVRRGVDNIMASVLIMKKKLSGDPTGPAALLARVPRGDLWVFGYGSLMWSPGFRYREKSIGLLHGYRRTLCILSHRYRGTPARPGLVLGLERSGSCRGVAYRVARRAAPAVLALLWHREMRGRAYVPRLVRVRLADARVVRALAFVADIGHPQYAGRLDQRERSRLVAQGVGARGACSEYLHNTLEHMRALGMRDAQLDDVLRGARRLRLRRGAV
jgi:cation transport protein ChaC